MVTFAINIPRMLPYIYHTWILWVIHSCGMYNPIEITSYEWPFKIGKRPISARAWNPITNHTSIKTALRGDFHRFSSPRMSTWPVLPTGMDEDVVIDRLKHGLQSWAVAVAVTWARAQWLWRFTTKNKSIPNNHGRLDCPSWFTLFFGPTYSSSNIVKYY